MRRSFWELVFSGFCGLALGGWGNPAFSMEAADWDGMGEAGPRDGGRHGRGPHGRPALIGPDPAAQPFSTSERGAPVVASFRLATRPTAEVTITLTSSDPTEGKVYPSTLTFTPWNWLMPKTAVVAGVPDLLADGDVAYTVAVAVTSSDRHYADLAPPPLVFVNRDRAVFHELGELPGGLVTGAVNDVSADGSVVVGCAQLDSSSVAFRWREDTGMHALEGDAGCAEGISDNGLGVVGWMSDPAWQGGRAAVVWQGELAPQHLHVPLGPSGPGLFWFTTAYDVTDDGLAVGTGIQNYGHDPLGLRAHNGVVDMPFPMAMAYATSADGAFIVGVQIPSRYGGAEYATRNDASLGYPREMTCITPAAGECTSRARDISADGSVVVGEAWGPPPGQTSGGITLAFAWTAADGMHWLPDIAGGIGAAVAYSINRDAVAGGRSVVAGFATDSAGRRATLWIDGAPRTVDELLAAEGVCVPPGWRLETARALSADGRVIVGEGTRPDGRRAGWRAVRTIQVPSSHGMAVHRPHAGACPE